MLKEDNATFARVVDGFLVYITHCSTHLNYEHIRQCSPGCVQIVTNMFSCTFISTVNIVKLVSDLT